MTSRHKEKINSVPHKHTSILQQCTAGGDQLKARLGVPLSRELEHVTLLHALPAKKPWAVKNGFGVGRIGPFFVCLPCPTISIHLECAVFSQYDFISRGQFQYVKEGGAVPSKSQGC